MLQQELERNIVHGLACEWETALWVLGADERSALRRPLFSIRNLAAKWGYWSGDKNELCVSRDLVLNHDWDSVREVLLHEIAHQYTEQVLGVFDQPPHGAAFQEACRRLRANPKASGRFRLLRERLAAENTGGGDRMLQRIRKLFALAQSRNRHEAEAAMAKAQELMTKYNVALWQEEPERRYFSVFVGKPALRHRREEYHLANLLQDYYFVHAIWVSAYVLPKGKMGHALEISGTPHNVEIAAYVYDFAKTYIGSQWAAFNRDGHLNRYRQTDFAVGIIEGFRSKLASRRKEAVTRQDAPLPVKLEDPLLKAYVAYRYPRTVTTRRNVGSEDGTVLAAGIKAGKKMVISKGITASSDRIKLLE